MFSINILMNGHCSKDIVTSIFYIENTFALTFSLFREYVCLME